MRTKTDLIGKRVRLDACTDPYTKLQHGDEGVVMDIDDIGTVHVLWDNGSILGLLTDEGDAFSIVEQETDDQITLEEKRTIRHLMKTSQFEFAEGLIAELVAIDPDIEISPFLLLDALGCAGLSLTIGTDASRTWIESLK